MPANGLTSSAKRTAGAGPTCTGSARKPMPATAATVRKGAIHRATAPAAENITPGKLLLHWRRGVLIPQPHLMHTELRRAGFLKKRRRGAERPVQPFTDRLG